MIVRKQEITLEFQNEIHSPPIPARSLYSQACSNDGPTLDTWLKIWIDHYTLNQKKHGPFKDHSVGSLHGLLENQPAIIVGSGPSLKHVAPKLKNRGKIKAISCLHNFHFLEDLGAGADFYVTLDAGPVTIEEVSEGGSKTAEEYWDITKDRTLLAFVGSHPDLLAKWRGKILFFNAPVPAEEYSVETEKIEPFHTYVSNGGNVLGGCLYLTKGIMGANPIIFTGSDFCFDYDKRFHAWQSKYDKNLGNVVKLTDVFGNKVLSWQSYANFKSWFEYVAMQVPGIYINASEGGTLGAYSEGNISAIKQMTFDDVMKMYTMHDILKNQCVNPGVKDPKILF